MKRLSVIICTALILFGFSSCFTGPENYYVKYEAQISSVHYGSDAKYVVSTESGSKTITTRSKTWTETFGPVKKSFTASVSGEAHYDGTMTLNIYVCRGEEPFVLKASKTGDVSTWGTMEGVEKPMTASVSYTIDF